MTSTVNGTSTLSDFDAGNRVLRYSVRQAFALRRRMTDGQSQRQRSRGNLCVVGPEVESRYIDGMAGFVSPSSSVTAARALVAGKIRTTPSAALRIVRKSLNARFGVDTNMGSCNRVRGAQGILPRTASLVRQLRVSVIQVNACKHRLVRQSGSSASGRPAHPGGYGRITVNLNGPPLAAACATASLTWSRSKSVVTYSSSRSSPARTNPIRRVAAPGGYIQTP